jgi:nucleoside-diphosphate-sugar epimerase
MAKTRKYNQRKSTRGKTPKKKNKMRQKGSGSGRKIYTRFKAILQTCKKDDDCIFHEEGGNSYKGDCIERKCQNVKKTTRVVRTSNLSQPRTLMHTSSGSYYVNDSILGRLQEAYSNYMVPSNAYRRSRRSF